MSGRYVLLDRLVRPADQATYDAFWQAEDPGRVALDIVGDIEISTVFLSRATGQAADGTPLLFETALFGSNGHIGVLRRYGNWRDAWLGHRAIVDELRRPRAN